MRVRVCACACACSCACLCVHAWKVWDMSSVGALKKVGRGLEDLLRFERVVLWCTGPFGKVPAWKRSCSRPMRASLWGGEGRRRGQQVGEQLEAAHQTHSCRDCRCTVSARRHGWPLLMSTSSSAWRARSRPQKIWLAKKFTKRMNGMATTGNLQQKKGGNRLDGKTGSFRGE